VVGATEKERLKNNATQAVLDALAPYLEPLEQTDETPVRDAWRYITNRLDHLDYQSALARDLPIGSGEIESAHRQVVQKRIKRPGAWWKLENADAMISLIAARLNGVWDKYWECPTPS
jgi:hypothetical protein